MNAHVAEHFRSALNSFAPLVDGEPVNYETCPAAHRESLRLFIERGVDPGTGLKLILAHDLDAVCYCDEETVKQLPAIYRWIYNHAPGNCHGSKKFVEDYMRLRRGMR
jgi:hypothetical protein